MLRKLSKEVRALDGSDLHRAYHALSEKDGDRRVEEEGQLTREVGFHYWSEASREFMEELIRRVERFNDLDDE